MSLWLWLVPVTTRLTGIIYPQSGAPTVDFIYGDTSFGVQDVDSALSRLTRLKLDGDSLAQWWYMGDSRRLGSVIGGHVQSFDGQGGPAWKLDRFGRVVRLEYTNGSGTALRHVYGYDARGNRVFNQTLNSDTKRSWRYAYDGLSRLVWAAKGDMGIDGEFLAGVQPETTDWSLDALGNWSGDASEESVHRFRDVDADGEFGAGDTTLAIDHHDVTASNEINQLLTVDSFGSNGVQPYEYDAAGNLVFNGKHFFTYDAWNRLAGIYEVGPEDVDSNGAVLGAESAWLALECLERFEYDALGRRVRTVLKPGTSEWKTTEHVYGTGAAVLEEYVEIGTTGVQSLARWFIHGESFPDPLYMIDLTAAGDVAAGTEEWLYYLKDALGSVMALVSLDSGSVVERYAYDPYGRTEVLALQIIGFGELAGLESELYHDADLDGDVDAADAADLMSCIGSTADDCVFFHDRTGNGRVDFVDAVLFANVFGGIGQTGEAPPKGHGRAVPKGLNVALEANTNGAGGGGPGAPGLDLADFESCFGSSAPYCQETYDLDESGTVDLGDLNALAGEIIIKPPPPIDYLRSRFGNPFLWTGQRYDPETKLYHFWARSYDPNTGRFLQEDMQGILAAVGPIIIIADGQSPVISPVGLMAGSEYSSGLNLYSYVGGNPLMFTDPFGLYEDEIDDLIADNYGQRLYALGALNEGAKWASLGLQTTLAIAASLLPGSGLYDAFQSVQVIASGRGGFWDAVNIAMVAFPLAQGISKVAGLRSLAKARGFGARACNCFVAGTQVNTPMGSVPIEEVSIGDEVYTKPVDAPDAPVHVGKVTQIFRRVVPAIVWITLANGATLGVTPDHQVWEAERGWVSAQSLAEGDSFVSFDGQPVNVRSSEERREHTRVYNLEIDGTFTYFAENVWVHNNSCRAIRKAIGKFDNHHALPMFLQGNLDGLTVKMNRVLHQKSFHPTLTQRLRGKNIWYGADGNWANYFQNHPDKAQEAMDVLLEVSRDFERSYGHLMDGSLTQSVWQQLMKQGMVVAP